VTVSGSEVSGAVNVVSTHTGAGGSNASWNLGRLDPGVTLQQVIQAVRSHGGDENAVTPLGSIIAAANAPGTVQTVLTPGNYVALNTTSMGPPGFTQFTVTQSPSPASLPAAAGTQKAIEFGFRGPKVLKNGSMVRAENGGFLVHMINLAGAKNKAAARALIVLLRRGASRKATRPFVNGQFVSLLNPASPGALQQAVLHAKPGWYVEACFMNTQDGREHTQLGMERIVRVVK
jgi:hypothetical protein